jgi:uncharacterized membrane protein YidH (DUF202 family)
MTGREFAAPQDSGLAVDRTILSWTRTALVAAALGALLLRTGIMHHSPLTLGAATAALLDAIAIGAVGRLRAMAIPARLAKGQSVAGLNSIGLVAVTTAMTLTLISLAIVLS